MNTLNQIEIKKAHHQQRQSIVSLLQAAGLPVADLPPVLTNFWIAVENNMVVGVIGLEQYGKCGLLRSMAVDSQYRNKGIASGLVTTLEAQAGMLGIDCIYLLTETAATYFERKEYKKVSRGDVPISIQASTEFNSVCPVSATVMKKSLA